MSERQADHIDWDRISTRATEIIGSGHICGCCFCTIYSYAEKCSAMLDDPCPGFLAVEGAREKALAEQTAGRALLSKGGGE